MDGSQRELELLTPNKSLESDEKYKVYKGYLDTALEKPDARNIAITGKYGSGKSSIIDTYFKERTDFLKVSFAAFESKSKDTKNDEEGDVEISDSKGTIFANIINQIIYQIETEKIPLTRFRIKRPILNSTKMFWIIELALFSTFFYRSSSTFFDWYVNVIFPLTVIFGLGIIWDLLSRFEFDKFKFSFKPVETELNMKRDDLFERYTDEIIYLFENSEKSILVIEDLDRFNDLTIFEKLRELNIKLNSKIDNVEKKWTFIYLMKDELFVDSTDRVKFFDLIIPIIPFLTTSNSFDKLREMFSEYGISIRLLRILGLYIDDFRLLLNICNEFKIYAEVAIPNDKDQLLALIAYKNLYPSEFDLIQNGEGILGKIVASFQQKIDDRIAELNEELLRLQSKRNSTSLTNEAEYLYVWSSEHNLKYSQIPSSNYHAQSIDSVARAREIIEKNYYLGVNEYNKMIDTAYADYKDKHNEFNIGVRVVTGFNENIEELKTKISQYQEKKLSLVERDSFDFSFDELLYSLIRNEFITLDYLYIINHYYGEISTQDFLRGIYADTPELKFDSDLSDISGIIAQLDNDDYDKPQILNINLANWLAENSIARFYQIISTANLNSAGQGFVEQLVNKYGSVYSVIVQEFSNIHFDLTLLDFSGLGDGQVIDILLNNRYDNNFSNVEIITRWIGGDITNLTFLEYLNNNTLYSTFKRQLIQTVNDGIRIIDLEKLTNFDLITDLVENKRIKVSASNINMYLLSIGFDQNFEYWVNNEPIDFDNQLGKSSILTTLNQNNLDIAKFTSFWSEYHGEKLDAEQLTSLKKVQIEVLLKLNVLNIDVELVKLIDERKIVITDDSADLLKQVIDTESLNISEYLLNQLLSRPGQLNNIIFSKNISSLSIVTVRDYLNVNNLSDGKFTKIISKARGYKHFIFENNEYNNLILDWMIKEGHMKSIIETSKNKLKPIYD